MACAAPAAVTAAAGGGRTLISTESIALQTQLLTSDLPVAADAVRQVLGVDVAFTVFKGWSNYGCPVAAAATLGQVAGVDVDVSGDPDAVLDAALRVAEAGGDDLHRLAGWVLLEAVTGGRGDKATCDVDVSAWGQVSVSPTECLGNAREAGCPLAARCPAMVAREEARECDIVVTNHSMLAIQAAKDAAVVLSNPSLGLFRHLVVDEAHALPEKVRDAGAHDLSARSVARAAKLLGRKFGTTGGITVASVDALVDQGMVLAGRLDAVLSDWLGRHDGDAPAITDEDNPVEGIGPELAAWCRDANRSMPDPGIPAVALDRYRVASAVGEVASTISAILDPEQAAARWVESGNPSDVERRRGWSGAVARLSPIDVADQISGNLFTVIERQPGQRKDPDAPRLPLSVSMVSATMPRSFAAESGVAARVVDYPSPFAAAYAASALFVPRVSDPAELAQVGQVRGNRWRFDVWRHPVWAAQLIVELVEANGGSALVLAAKADTGRQYAAALRRATGLTVLSQWDGGDVNRVAAAWKADRDAVLVGTRSLMTGLDAAGDTCTLVVLDRVPRAPNNVVDDARVAAVMSRLGLDKWAADRFVYGGDAALRMEQAAGRLIRRVDDTGMVAVLDPRLMKGAPLSYPEAARAALMSAFRCFPVRTGDREAALGWLRAQASARLAVPA